MAARTPPFVEADLVKLGEIFARTFSPELPYHISTEENPRASCLREEFLNNVTCLKQAQANVFLEGKTKEELLEFFNSANHIGGEQVKAEFALLPIKKEDSFEEKFSEINRKINSLTDYHACLDNLTKLITLAKPLAKDELDKAQQIKQELMCNARQERMENITDTISNILIVLSNEEQIAYRNMLVDISKVVVQMTKVPK